MTLEKTGESQTLVYRDEMGVLMMRLPNDPTVQPYDGRFGEIPNSVTQVAFPVESSSGN